VSVVAGQTRRRWALVAGGVVLLCAMPTIDSVLPVNVPRVSAAALREHILTSEDRPFAGYAESDASFGLPTQLEGFGGVASLLDGVTRMRVWQAAPNRWRVDVLSDVGEDDTYDTAHGTYLWDSDSELLTQVLGQYPVRLPRAADLLPSALAIRLLREAGSRARVSSLAPRRVAGIAAVGLRLTPDDPASTIAQVDIWAEPVTWLPLQVEIFGRGSAQPAIETEFLQVSSWRPDASTLTPQHGPGTGFTQIDASDLSGALNDLGPVILPGSLAERTRITVPLGFDQVGIYGQGLATFAVLQIDGSTGLDLISDALSDGATALKGPQWSGAVMSTRIITAVLLHPNGGVGTFVLAGFVDRQVLQQAASQLASDPW
jgi:hypothetical protein